MCFSATASFSAGTLPARARRPDAEGGADVARVALQAIPLLFAIQQLIEGVVWLTFSHEARC